MKNKKSIEILEELRMVFAGRNKILDSVIPPLVFLLVNAWLGFIPAVWLALGSAAVFTVFRLLKRQSVAYAFGGLGAVLLASILAFAINRAEGFFLPNIISGGLTVLACLISAIVRRPLVAWTSYVVRRWPLQWYWHPKVRPAYSEVTLAWAVYSGLRLYVQVFLFQEEAVGTLAVVNIFLGWPVTILLLIVSYIYGTWRLRNLQGPSVEEFKVGTQSPWQSQRRGF